jgi:hypothetical protein
MSKKTPAIEKRRIEAEALIKKAYGKLYSKIAAAPPEKQTTMRLHGLVHQSCQEASIKLTKGDLRHFVAYIIERADAKAESARKNYIYSLTRRTRLPIFGASAFADWKRKQIVKSEKSTDDDDAQ